MVDSMAMVGTGNWEGGKERMSEGGREGEGEGGRKPKLIRLVRFSSDARLWRKKKRSTHG